MEGILRLCLVPRVASGALLIAEARKALMPSRYWTHADISIDSGHITCTYFYGPYGKLGARLHNILATYESLLSHYRLSHYKPYFDTSTEAMSIIDVVIVWSPRQAGAA